MVVAGYIYSFDSDDDVEFVETFFNVVQHVHAEESLNAGRTRAVVNRDRQAAHDLLVRDYFADNCIYNDDSFERRFRLNKAIFLRISNALESRYDFFKQKPDARGRMGFSSIQKCAAALRYLGYDIAFDASDEYLKVSERTAVECVDWFSACVYEVFHEEYLHKPTQRDIERLYSAHEERHGFPGMLGSLDCTHVAWEKCPSAWRGQFTRGDIGEPTIILEAVASQDLWIWHAFFGVAGSNNDLNVLGQSPLFNDIWTGKAPDMTFTESARKDIERAFGVLKQTWHVVKYATRLWDKERIKRMVLACIIMHNMIIEDEGRAICTYDPNDVVVPIEEFVPGTNAFLERVVEIHNSETCFNLREDVVEHLYQHSMNDD
uniref:DDE Tnp4 domain-containing protein n=1 Tax=Lactuca sativa TaxID=4236 RepID=A0A9R1VBB3_LACSA|nr:hypothetical protein LSAT_V11C600299180 [Lactuca sativa]